MGRVPNYHLRIKNVRKPRLIGIFCSCMRVTVENNTSLLFIFALLFYLWQKP